MSINPTADITVHPTFPQEAPIFGVRTPGDSDRADAGDVAKAANPLHYVPFVSQVYEAATGNTGSSAMKLIGGAVLGGPIGFLASLAGVIFEQQTGQSMVGAVASAFTGDETVKVANTQTAGTTQTASLRDGDVRPAGSVEILPPQKQAMAQQTQMQVASAMEDAAAPLSREDAQVLSLFGGQPPSAHQSYQKAQMLPYLKDVSTSMVL